jgi:NAD(P)-dependent dehydrogenase (short-subunit alcohol dehydrogenase family)
MKSGENVMDLFEGKGGRLEGKVAVVTGGSSGIGLAIVKEFLKQGAKVAIASRTAYDLGDLPERLRLNAIAVAADVSKNDDLTRLFDKTAEAFGKIDVVVANAGVSKFAPLEQITEDDFGWIFDINVKGMFFTVQKGTSPFELRCVHHPDDFARRARRNARRDYVQCEQGGRSLPGANSRSRPGGQKYPRECVKPRGD